MMSSLKIRAVKEMATTFKNSFSNRKSDIIMIAPPDKHHSAGRTKLTSMPLTLIYGYHEPFEESLVRQRTTFYEILVQFGIEYSQIFVDIPVKYQAGRYIISICCSHR
jgi:hypothetical protein